MNHKCIKNIYITEEEEEKENKPKKRVKSNRKGNTKGSKRRPKGQKGSQNNKTKHELNKKRFEMLQQKKRTWKIYRGAYFASMEDFQNYVMTTLSAGKKPTTASYIQHWTKV